MNTLVTGATGLLGNNVTRLLLSRGHQVRVLVRESSDPRALQGLDVEVIHGDVRDPGCLDRAVLKMHCVIHAAANVHIGWSGLDRHRAVNVEGTRNVAEAAGRAGIRMVHVSTTDAVGVGTFDEAADEQTPYGGNPPCPYPVTKRAAEQIVAEMAGRGLDAVIVNPAYMFGPFDWKPSSGRMLLEVASGRCLVAPPGGNTFCDARDVAEGILSAAERGVAGRRYILGGQFLRYLDAWRFFADITGARGPICTVGPAMRFVGGLVGDLRTRITGREPDVNSASIRLACLAKNFSSDRAIRELGYRNRPLRQTVLDAWNWFRDNGYVRVRPKIAKG